MPELDKDAFLSTVIHELRAPLNACLMSVNLLELKAHQPAEVLRCADVFKRNLERQARLIQDLADVLQIVAGELELVTDPADLGGLADAAVDRLNSVDVVVDWRTPTEPQPVEVDTDRVARVLDTLLEHQAAAAGSGAQLTVEVQRDAADRVRLEVRPAPGRDGRASPAGQKGFAVRLAIAEQVIEAHGGRLHCAPDGLVMELPLRGTE